MIELHIDFVKKALKLKEGEIMKGYDSNGTQFYIAKKKFWLLLYYEGECRKEHENNGCIKEKSIN